MENVGENKFKIVLVDDDKSFCEVMNFVLSKEGFDIKCYTDPKVAFSEIKENPPDLILLDIAMPQLNGFEMLVSLKKELKEKTPKIFMITALNYTDNGTKIDEDYVKSIGADGLIKKDENLKESIEKIKKALIGKK